MNLSKFQDLSIKYKLIILQSIVILVTQVLFTIFIVNSTGNSILNMIIQDMTSQSNRVTDMIEAYNNSLKHDADRISKVFQSFFPEKFIIDNSKNITVGDIATPILRCGNITLNLNFSQVDRFTSITGSVATIFVRKGEDFVRITTSLKKEDGSRAMGTILDRSHPAYNKLLKNEQYVGKATLFGKYYMTKYTPIVENGRTIAALFIGSDFTEGLQSLTDKIKSIKVGMTGYVFVLNSKEGKEKGNLLIHPFQEGKNVYESKDESGQMIFKEMIEKKSGFMDYIWINAEAGEKSAREKIAVYNSFSEWDWIIVYGSYKDEFLSASYELRNALIAFSFFVLLAQLGMLFFTSNKFVSRPINRLIDVTKDLATGEGDLTKRLPVKRKDEIAEISKFINTFVEKVHHIIKDVSENTDTLNSSSVELSDNATNSAKTSVKMSEAVKHISGGMNDINQAISQIAASVEEMNYSIKEVAKNCHLESSMASQANEKAGIAQQIMEHLNSFALNVGKIVGMISEISAQTNLLALNATIESARAGEAGKGFAVVANEVKELSKQTDQATVQITEQIKEMQNNSQQALTSIEEIVKIINDVNNISQTIASSVEEQSATMSEVSKLIHQSNQTVQNEIIGSLTAVDRSAEESSQTVVSMKNSSENLLKMAHELKKLVKQFKI